MDELREKIAIELWRQFSASKYSWEYLISTRKKAWYKRADEFIQNTEISK